MLPIVQHYLRQSRLNSAFALLSIGLLLVVISAGIVACRPREDAIEERAIPGGIHAADSIKAQSRRSGSLEAADWRQVHGFLPNCRRRHRSR